MRLLQATFIAVGFLAAMILAGCSDSRAKASPDSGGRLAVVATTGMVADLVRNVAGEHATVETLMGPGVDPHLYKATSSDLDRLQGARVVFYSGLHLEGKMTEILEKIGRLKPVVAVGDAVPRERLRSFGPDASAHDPHIWFDVALWSLAIDPVVKTLSEADPAHAAAYVANGERYRAELEALDAEVRVAFAKLPEAQRVLVTAHDAFGYYGRAYGIDVLGLQGVSTASEFGLSDINRLVETIAERKVRAVFVESSISPRSIEAVVEGVRQRGHEVRIGGTLFSDALGPAGSPEGTYVGMVRHNTAIIIEALR